MSRVSGRMDRDLKSKVTKVVFLRIALSAVLCKLANGLRIFVLDKCHGVDP